MNHIIPCRSKLPPLARNVEDSDRRRAAPGITLIEVLIAVSIVGLLAGLLIPTVASARRQARSTLALSNLRQTAVWFSLYAEQHHGVLPFAPPGTVFRVTPPEDSQPATIAPGFWDLSYYWPALFHQLAPWSSNFRLWVIPDVTRDPQRPWSGAALQGQPSFVYCRSLFARPELWSPELSVPSLADEERLLKPVRLTEVLHSAAKVLLFDDESPRRARPNQAADDIDHRLMNFVDGHAIVHRLSKASDPVQARLTDPPPPRRLHDTRNGARGLDY